MRTPVHSSARLIAVVVSSAVMGSALTAQPICARLGVPWWQVGATRFLQSSGSGQRQSGVSIERHFVDRRVLRRLGAGYRLEIVRTRLGLVDTTVQMQVDFGANGQLFRVGGDVEGLARDVAPLLTVRCNDIRPGSMLADLGGHVDTVRSAIQRGLTRINPSAFVRLGAIVDSLGQKLVPLTALRSVTDSSNGEMLRRRPGRTEPDTVHPWTRLAGEETERLLVRASDGAVVFRSRTRLLTGRGWVPPHEPTDTVPLRVESVTIERVVDSLSAVAILTVSRRGERSVSTSPVDTVALHFREWRGDTLVLRQFRRTGLRDELRTVWRDSVLLGGVRIEPGMATQPPGVMRRTLTLARGFLRDGATSPDSVATPVHPWSIALDGFEDALVPALLGIPADSSPHRFSLYGMQPGGGAWLNWSVNVLVRGDVRVARFTTLQGQWVGTFIYTVTGELLLVNLGGQQGVTRVPAAGSRLALLLERQRGVIRQEDMVPVKR